MLAYICLRLRTISTPISSMEISHITSLHIAEAGSKTSRKRTPQSQRGTSGRLVAAKPFPTH